MTADLATAEFLTFAEEAQALELTPRRRMAQVFHEYGRLAIAEGGAAEAPAGAPEPEPELAGAPTLTETLGRAAFDLRNTPETRAMKLDRPYQGLTWGADVAEGPMPLHLPGDEIAQPTDAEGPAPAPEAEAEPPLSSRLTGRVAVGLVIVSGDRPGLRLNQQEQTLIVSEVQNGLSFLASQAPARDVTFVHDIRVVTVNVPEVTSGTSYEDFEAPWRDAALQELGLPPGSSGARRHARNLRAQLGTNWAYVAFFTKYKLRHFAYAALGGPKLVMHFGNDGWGSNQIDRVFAHETGHIFNAPDEYASSNCTCGGSWGVFGAPNANCAVCAPGGGVDCIMQSNDWSMCGSTLLHLGYNGVPHPGMAAGTS